MRSPRDSRTLSSAALAVASLVFIGSFAGVDRAQAEIILQDRRGDVPLVLKQPEDYIVRLELLDNEFSNTTIVIHPSVKTVVLRGDISRLLI